MSPGEGNAMPLVFGEGNGPRDEYPRVYERNVNIQIIDAGGSQFLCERRCSMWSITSTRRW